MVYKKVKLLDIASIERATNKEYFPGVTIVQISATRGQVEYVEDDINIQKEQVKNMEIIERAILLSEQELSEVKEFKNTMLSKIFCS